MPSIDLKYCSMIVRLLGTGILLVMMEILPEKEQIYSVHIVDLIFFNNPFIRLI